MYDTDEEIKKKRRNLIITICVIVGIILLLIIFLLSRNSGKKKNNNTATEIACTLGVEGDIVPDNNGVYHQPVTIEYKNIVAISKDYQIVKKTIGTVDRSSNKETFTATNTGSYHVYGYVQDSAGHRGKCEFKFQIALSVPTCELEVSQGTLGENNWYRSDAVVGFKSMSSNNQSVSIAKYYIEKAPANSETATKADPTAGNIDKLTITDNGTTSLIGHVIDSSGNEGTCTLEVSKDSTVPSCKLKVLSGTKNEGGIYTDVPEIGFEETNDTISLLASKGIGISKNYESETYKVTQEGKTTVVGYVKDKAGNEGTCSLEISRPGGNVDISKPTCSISLSGSGKSGVYSQDVKATLNFSTTNGATIVKYGIAESETYNQRKEISITNNGSHRVYGIVQDSNGKVARCSTSTFTIKKAELLVNKVSVGDYVAYDAGNWTETRSEKAEDGYYWGMKSGTSKQTGVRCNSADSSTRSGWIVLGKTNGQVLLIHAGTPECIYHGRVSTSKVINTMTSEAQKYVNTKYANGWTALSCNTPGFDCNKSSYSGNVFVSGTAYWVAQNGANNTLNAINPSGKKESYALRSVGLRPVIQLKADVMTTGKVNGVWQLQ